ncbi:glycine cleavage system aminomethyltransferase GcvT [Conyzicola nivalis]|uniref:Aminomethyltransferase n=1 Tax=Conyzicola nivalis TaxID=1477021 RepID=A0A916SB84_9MICO|nr:glycine cleavage system aminomethyltransferase GcvT [Conyzicola nivalis]GGA89727.1 aminomethyltransferase [Conyzicola nivalis]
MTDPRPDSDRTSPLHQIHVDGGASFTDFAGWQMPVSYGSDLAEHHAVRTTAGIFDISHMAEILVDGPDAAAFLDYALAGRLSAISIAQAKYSLLLNPEGGIVDDLVTYRLTDDTFFVVANAGNRFAVATALQERAENFDVRVSDLSDSYALIAVQGPNSREIAKAAAGITEVSVPLDELKYYWSTDALFDDQPLLIGRTGYTGEDGFEFYIQTDAAASLWAALVVAGEAYGLVPAGLASRDTLRLEAGMPLYGHELGIDSFPVQAGLGRVVNLKKEGDFVGRSAVEAGPPHGSHVLVGLTTEGKRAGRAGYSVVTEDGSRVGMVTSGALSPTLGHPVAMAYVDPFVIENGTPIFIDVRGNRIAASVVDLPFYKRDK